MEILVKNLFNDLEKIYYPDLNQISQGKNNMILNAFKERLELTVQNLFDKIAEKDIKIDELTKINQQLKMNSNSIDGKLLNAAELKTKVKRLEDENFSLKKRIKFLISFEKNKESTYSERTENQLRTSSSLTSENSGQSKDKCNNSFTSCNFSNIGERIKALEKGVDSLLDSQTLQSLQAHEGDPKTMLIDSKKTSRNKSFNAKLPESSPNILTFNHAYMKNNKGIVSEPREHQ